MNSLHNLTASGANALAESQALNSYFGELYEPFALVSELKRILAKSTEQVVILTGHAGDGKSTVALDVFKSIQNLPLQQPLNSPMLQRVVIPTDQGYITIVKDMSELSSIERQSYLKQAFEEEGRWLIVSNTGPLLHSLLDYGESQGQKDIESRVLALLDAPLNETALEQNVLNVFNKPLLILNLTRLDNVALGARILGKLIAHSGWAECAECSIVEACPLVLNRRALLETKSIVMNRVRWIYRRISDYEQRLTLRQIVAQLAFGLTGGMSCAEAQARIEVSTAIGAKRGIKSLQEILFSESFFGYRAGIPDSRTERLQAIALLRRSMMGGPVSASHERELIQGVSEGWAELPNALEPLAEFWQRISTDRKAVSTRAALRRMLLMFGKMKSNRTNDAQIFFDTMLHSPGLRALDDWQRAGKLELSLTESKNLRKACLNVLLEAFSGFSASQFEARHDNLYLTLRRPDRAVVQPTQLIIGSLPFRDFDLKFDSVMRLPKLIYRPAAVELLLTLPLLDYIHRRAAGELGNDLTPIYQAQLNRFQGELLQVDKIHHGQEGEISFLRAGIDGDVKVYRYTLDEQKQRLEKA
ncbi:hypothetical protein CKO09_02235 [Chromatium weissei]|nr:hypothetical protein [Chromatium weissei]